MRNICRLFYPLQSPAWSLQLLPLRASGSNPVRGLVPHGLLTQRGLFFRQWGGVGDGSSAVLLASMAPPAAQAAPSSLFPSSPALHQPRDPILSTQVRRLQLAGTVTTGTTSVSQPKHYKASNKTYSFHKSVCC